MPKRSTSRFGFRFWELLLLPRDPELEPDWDLEDGGAVQLSPPPPADCRIVIIRPRRSRRSDRALLLSERREDEGHPEEKGDSAVMKGRKGGPVSNKVSGVVVEEIEIGSKRGDESAELAVAVPSSSENNMLSSSAEEEKKSEREAVEEKAELEIMREKIQV